MNAEWFVHYLLDKLWNYRYTAKWLSIMLAKDKFDVNCIDNIILILNESVEWIQKPLAKSKVEHSMQILRRIRENNDDFNQDEIDSIENEIDRI